MDKNVAKVTFIGGEVITNLFISQILLLKIIVSFSPSWSLQGAYMHDYFGWKLDMLVPWSNTIICRLRLFNSCRWRMPQSGTYRLGACKFPTWFVDLHIKSCVFSFSGWCSRSMPRVGGKSICAALPSKMAGRGPNSPVRFSSYSTMHLWVFSLKHALLWLFLVSPMGFFIWLMEERTKPNIGFEC